MLDSKIKSIIDTARNILVGKVPNPQSQIDLITIAMIYKFMDDMDKDNIEYGGEASFFKDDLEPYAWSKLMNPSLGNEGRISLYSEALEKLELSEQIPELFRRIFKGAFLPFRDGATLTMFLKEINKLSYDNSENLGNGFEYLLSIMGSQGDAGQFRTPRHIIDFMVDVVNPQKEDTILDPACGTAGFLISAYKHILKHNSEAFDPDNDEKTYASQVVDSAEEVDIEIEKNLSGDKLSHSDRMNLTSNIKGYDIDPTMQMLALVNLYLHGFKSPDISEYDTLTQEEKWGDEFNVILANPPFMTPKGGIKPHKKFSVKANRSEVLFVDYIAEHLSLKGKAGIIVPEGIIFQSQTAYKSIRKKLVDENYLYAVVSLPSGVFQPYSGVKTSVLLIDREIAKRSDDILFIDVKNDGFDLGAQRRAIKKNDLPEAYDAIKEFQTNHCHSELVSESIQKYKLANLVKKEAIAQDEDYNLTSSKYVEAIDYSNCKWDMAKLSDVCEKLFAGGDVPKDNHAKYKTEEYTVPIYSNGIADNSLYGYTNIPKVCEDAITISARGTIGYAELRKAPFYPVVRLIVAIPCQDKINLKYLKHILQNKDISGNGNSIPQLTVPMIKDTLIPLPPLEVQEEIVAKIEVEEQAIEQCKNLIKLHEEKIANKIKSIWGEEDAE